MQINITHILNHTYNYPLPSMRISIGDHLLFIKAFDDPNQAYATFDHAIIQGHAYFSLDEQGNLWLELGKLL